MANAERTLDSSREKETAGGEGSKDSEKVRELTIEKREREIRRTTDKKTCRARLEPAKVAKSGGERSSFCLGAEFASLMVEWGFLSFVCVNN